MIPEIKIFDSAYFLIPNPQIANFYVAYQITLGWTTLANKNNSRITFFLTKKQVGRLGKTS